MRFACVELTLLALLASCTQRGAAAPDAHVPPPPPPARVEAPTPPPPPARFDLPPGARLAWVSEASGTPQVVLDGRALTSGPAAHYLSAVTATQELVVTRVEGDHESLLLLSPDGGVKTVSPASARARNASTARGRVLFEGEGAGLSSVVDERGAKVIDDPAGSFEPSLAPDGTWFAFVSSRDGDAEIYRASIDGGQQQRLTAFHLDDVSPKVSPDGQWVLFTSNREGSDRLFLVRPDGRGQRRLHPEDAPRQTDGGVEAAEADAVWSPDGRSVIYSAREHGGRWHLFRVDVASGARTQLTDGPFDDQLPAPSPDGRSLAFVSTRGGPDAELYLRSADGGVSRITTQRGSDWKPLWLR